MVLNEPADEETGMVWGAGIGRQRVTRLVVGLLLLSLFSPAFAQEIQWIRPFSSGDDGAVGGTVDTAGNVYVIGSTGGAMLGQIGVANVDAFVVNLEPGTPPLEANQLVGRVPTQLDVFYDEFDQSQLREGWFWVREDPSAWSLVENPGNLRIYTQYGSLDGGIANNVLLRRGPTSVFSITARIHINPTRDWHEAVLLLYKDDENYVKISRLYHSGLGGNVYLLYWEQNGVCFAGFTTPTSQTTVELQLVVQEHVVIGLFKNENGDWVKLGRIAMDTTRSYPYVGITAHNGARYIPSIPADIDFVAVRSLALCQITGRVTDATTGKEIAGAKVEASGPTTASATTDSNGNYSLSLSPGTYTLTASASGYQSQTKTGVTVTAGSTTTVNFALTSIGPGNRPPSPPTNLGQFLPDGTAIPIGGAMSWGTVIFKATVSDPDGNKVKLQVELRRLDELGGGFDETQGGLKEGALVSSGDQATATASGLIRGNYHWRARAIDEGGLASPWVEFGGNPTSSVDFEVGFWVEVANAGKAGAAIHTAPLPTAPRAKVVPNGWVLWCRDTHDNQKEAGGVIWWEVEDQTDGLRGWIAAMNSAGDSRYLLGAPEDEEHQRQLMMKAEPSYADTMEERIAIIREAVLHYFGNRETTPSLYSSNDTAKDARSNALSDLYEYGFPVEVVFAIIAQESGGIAYSNLGDGVMQVDWEGNKGLASNIQCFSNDCRYYGNTKQSIYANVKDGLKVLRDFYVPLRTREDAYVLATWKYNGGYDPLATYCKCRGDPFYLVHVGVRLSGDDLLDGEHVCEGQTFACVDCRGGICRKNEIRCRYSARPTVVDFGFDLQPDLAQSFKRYQRDQVSAAVCSRASILIRDSQGRVVGIVGEEYVEEIPTSICAGNVVVIFLPSDNYRYEVRGVEEEVYSLVINRTIEDQAAVFTAFNVPIRANALHCFLIDWDALARGEKGVTLKIDQDGDGVFERMIQAGSELRGDDIGTIPTGSTLNHGPNPIPAEGCTFWFNLPQGTRSAKLLIFNVAGRQVAEIQLDPTATRYPATGRWLPVDRNGVPLANGPYVYVLIADGRVIGQGKMVIQR